MPLTWDMVQDGYAVVASDGPGEYVVAFAAHAGTEQQRLESGTVAYITTGAFLRNDSCHLLTEPSTLLHCCSSERLVVALL